MIMNQIKLKFSVGDFQSHLARKRIGPIPQLWRHAYKINILYNCFRIIAD